MSNDNDPDHDIQEKILSQIQAGGLVPKKELSAEELQKLKSAASRLDQLLNRTTDADRQALQTAAARLDQLLADIGSGKDVSHALKQRRDRQDGKD
jgi:Rad3-related DNA helicase